MPFAAAMSEHPLTAHAVGEPGKRVFWIQGRRDRELISLIAEKEQVRALAQAINQLLEDLAEKNPLTWMIEINGFVVDLRYMPREVQEVAFAKGMIPHIPTDREGQS